MTFQPYCARKTRKNAVLRFNFHFGKNVRVVGPVNIYGCHIGQDSFVGPFTEIQKDVIIGERCKIQSHSFICSLVSIGNDCFIGHGVMFINDLFNYINASIIIGIGL